MSVLSQILCPMGRHEPLRRKVEWNGQVYVGKCRHCGKDIERVAHRHWKLAKPAREPEST